jgi:pyruvate dehydrogenase E2 component (dihydrolipoamide acetyltransferase)
MRFEFKLPDIGEGVAEGEIVAWHVAPGDSVKEDQAMVEVMTDKATVTIGAPKKGTIVETCAPVGQVLAVGKLLVVIETEGAQSSASAAPASNTTTASSSPSASASVATASPAAAPRTASAPAAPGAAATAVGDIRDTLPGANFFEQPRTNGSATRVTDRPLATPAVRKLARELDVDLHHVRGTGTQGRITADDVRGLGRAEPAAPVTSAPSRAAATSVAPTEREERKPFVGMRRKIAERMQTTKNTAAHFTFVEECNAARLIELRNRLRPAAEREGVKLTFLPFIVKAVVASLKKHPVLNSALDETKNELVYRRYYDIGIAASTDRGLMVPVVKDADRRSLLDVAREIERLGTAAKNGTIQSHELTGSTFTITSLGAQGGLFATPILNHPEVGILGVHQMKRKPLVQGDQIVIGDVMLLSLSFDHRIVDGHVGAAFAYEVIGYLEEPERLFLE